MTVKYYGCGPFVITVEPVDKHYCKVHAWVAKDTMDALEDLSQDELSKAIDAREMAFMHGEIKWDDCANFNWNPQNVLTHFCGPDEFVELIRKVWQCAREAMPTTSIITKRPV